MNVPENTRPPAPPIPSIAPPPAPAPSWREAALAAHVSRFSVARLHNLGNFEHVRYEVTVEVPLGVRASDVLRDVDALLLELNPKRPHGEYALEQARNVVAELNKEPAEDDILADSPDQAAMRRRQRQRAQAVIDAEQLWAEQRTAALARLDALGGSARYGGGRTDDGNDYDEE